MKLPIVLPLSPMLARLVNELPDGDYLFEPKWDGFRAIVFRDGSEIEILSRNERPLTRYFPELAKALPAQLPARCVVDGEIVIHGERGLDFDALLQRIHPADSRIQQLARDTPAAFVAFDLLALNEESLLHAPFRQRREELERALARAEPPLHVTPATRDRAKAQEWFARFEGAGLDGIVAKPLGAVYAPGKREMLKLKHARTADCVVGGFRVHTAGGVGSLLLGLYDEHARLQHVGVATGFSADQRRRLSLELAPLRRDALADHPWAEWRDDAAQDGTRMPGGPSRWTGQRELHWEPVRPARVVEVAYDHLQGPRFRHATRFVRWRDDREPRSCTYAQLETAPPHELSAVFGQPSPERARPAGPASSSQQAPTASARRRPRRRTS